MHEVSRNWNLSCGNRLVFVCGLFVVVIMYFGACLVIRRRLDK